MKNLFYLFILVLISQNALAQNDNKPIVDGQVVFQEENGLLVVEAENFFKQSKTNVRQWYRTSKNEIPNVGRDEDEPHYKGAGNNAYLEILPDTRVTNADKLIAGENFSNIAGELGVLHYRVNFTTTGRYYVWVRAYSTGSEDNGLHVGVDGTWPESGQRMQWCNGKNSWHWESKQRTEEEHCGVPYQIYLDISEKGMHDITFSMREDGFEFDQFLMTTDKNFVPDANDVTAFNALPETQITGELKKWHKVTLTFDGPELDENSADNPFFNYRLNVLFTNKKSGKSLLVPGYFAADGNAGETSATKGNKWRVHFAPPETGEWTYHVDFRKGRWVAVSDRTNAGESAGYMDGVKGSFTIEASDKTGNDFRSKGRLVYDGTRYLKFAETDKIFLKIGADAPENFLAYDEFDGDFKSDGHKDNLVKTWAPHLKDWKEGDPTWQNGKGKAIIGAINYLASKGMNSFSFLTMNIVGDDQNVFPYINYDTYNRFDCSKLDQWEVLFEHADQLGMFMHFKLMEQENQGLLDNGAIGAYTKLYYREMMARFGHHLALNWNICEESGDWVKNHKTPPMFTVQRLAAAEYFYNHDPYHHHVVIHNGVPFDDLLGANSKYTGISLQTNHADFRSVHERALHWIEESGKAGKQWAVSVDEPGDAQHALIPDSEDPDHDNARINGLWGAFMAGAWGTEWYFGYKHANSDLTCQDYRSRDLFWDQGRYLLQFFNNNNLDLESTSNHDELVNEGDYCLAKPGATYIVFLRNGNGTVNLKGAKGKFSLKWYDPRNGGELQTNGVDVVKGNKIINLERAPSEPNKDWAVLLKKL